MRLLGSLIALVALLTACSDDPEPKFAEPSESPSVSGTAAAQRETAKEFLRRWVEAEAAWFTTGDYSEIEELNAPDCDGCRATKKRIDATYRAGGAIDFKGSRLQDIRQLQRQEWRVSQNVRAYRFRESGDTSWTEVPAEHVVRSFVLRRAGDTWVLADYYDMANR